MKSLRKLNTRGKLLCTIETDRVEFTRATIYKKRGWKRKVILLSFSLAIRGEWLTFRSFDADSRDAYPPNIDSPARRNEAANLHASAYLNFSNECREHFLASYSPWVFTSTRITTFSSYQKRFDTYEFVQFISALLNRVPIAYLRTSNCQERLHWTPMC